MSDRDDLITRWELGQTDANDEAVLAELLRDPAARRAFARNARVTAALGAPATISAKPLPTPAFASGTTRQRKAFRIRPARSARGPQWAVAASVLLIVGVVAMLVVTQKQAVAPTSHGPTAQLERPTTPAPTAAPFARLITASGTTIIAVDGHRRSGTDGGTLATGETVETTTSAAAIVLGINLAHLDLAPGSALRLPIGVTDPLVTAVRLKLERGRVIAEVAARQVGALFTVAAALASVEVVGTRFTFGVDEREAHLTVDHGSVRLSSPTDAGVLVSSAQTALVSEGLVSIAPAAPDPDPPLPSGAKVLWRVTTDDQQGWRGAVDTTLGGGPVWRSVAPLDQDPWSRAELRSPVARSGWTVEAGTWLRFRYHVERFSPGLTLAVHLKPSNESNFDQRITPDTTDGWHQALMRIDGAFRHLGPEHQPLGVGEQIHGAVWCAMRDGEQEAPAARFWVRDVVVYVGP